MFFEVHQRDLVATSGKVLEQLLIEMLEAVRKHRADSDGEAFQLFIESTMDQADGRTHSEVGIYRFDAKSAIENIYGRVAGWLDES